MTFSRDGKAVSKEHFSSYYELELGTPGMCRPEDTGLVCQFNKSTSHDAEGEIHWKRIKGKSHHKTEILSWIKKRNIQSHYE